MSEDDPRVLDAVQEYFTELEARRRPDRRAFVARHADIADELTPYLDALDAVHAAAPLLHQAADVAANPEPVGDFRIVRELGRGGMGVVYEAVQLSLGRRVALKILPFAAALDPKQLHRFKTEAHAAAGLHHTNIVPVYAVGCERGVHFYAMQLIDGRPLDAVVRGLSFGTTVELRAGPTSRGEKPHRAAARMAMQVAEALEYAHEQGVIHRDIKPANLLLDGKGNVWVTDFGLAQVSANAGLTQTGDVFGTLRYMSPEQATGRRTVVDHRTDVYSLGATLYELLTLQPVFPGQDRQTLLHRILNEEPKGPRSLDRSIPVELETIVLKSLAKSPHDRYATAGEMAADLRRFLDDRPILARRPTVADRARKWLRRHPSAVGVTFVLLTLAAVGLAAFTAIIAREKSRTEEAYLRERQRFELARRSVDQMIAIGGEETPESPESRRLRRSLLEAALAYYQEFIELRRDDPDAQAELEATRDRVQTILADLAVLQGAGQLFMLGEPDVLDDLKIAPGQRSKVEEMPRRLAERGPALLEEFHRLSAEERRSRLVGMVRAAEAEVAESLTPAQMRRLAQIALQRLGAAAFREPEVVAALKLTPSQRDRLRTLEGEIVPVPGHLKRGPPPGPPGFFRPVSDKMLAVLTDEQRSAWAAMAGEPFRPSRPPRPFGPPR